MHFLLQDMPLGILPVKLTVTTEMGGQLVEEKKKHTQNKICVARTAAFLATHQPLKGPYVLLRTETNTVECCLV